MITELTEAVVCLGAWHCYDTESGRGGFADFDDDALRKTVPPELAQLIKQGVLHCGFGLCYSKRIAEKLYPFDRAMDADAAFLKACLDDDDVNVCSVRDAGALCLQVLPGLNRTVALTSCSSVVLGGVPGRESGRAGMQRRAVEARFICLGRRGAGRGRRGRGDACLGGLEPERCGVFVVLCVCNVLVS